MTNGNGHDRFAVASEIGALLTSSLVLEEVLPNVARLIAEALDAWECDLYEYAPAENCLICAAFWSQQPTPKDEAWVGGKIDLAERPDFDAIVLERRVLAERAEDEMSPAERQSFESWSMKSTLTGPLVFDDEVIGCLTLIEKREGRAFNEVDQDLFRDLSVPAAIAIHNARMFRQQQEQNRRLSSLLDASRAITSTVVLEDVLGLVARKAADALSVSHCEIFEYDAGADQIIFRSFFDPNGRPRSPLGSAFPLADYPGDKAILLGSEPVEERVSDEGTDPANREFMERWGWKSCLTVPLWFGEEPLGLLMLVETDRERSFTAEDVDLARGLSEQAAVAIENARLFRREELRNTRLLGLLEASQALTSLLDLREVLRRVRAEVATVLGNRKCAVEVRLRDEEGFYLPFEAALHDGDETAEDVDVAPPDTHALSAITGLAPEQRASDDDAQRLIVPLVVRERAEGYVDVVSRPKRGFSEDEVELVQILANQAAVAVENARLYQTIEQQAITDGLTGLYNHRYFYERLSQEVAKAQRYGTPLSLLMLDLDDFKAYNDAYGHPAGDLVLRETADIMLTKLRRNVDLPARYGGEEFAVILPNTPAAGARVVGARLVEQVTGLVSGANTEVVVMGGAGSQPAPPNEPAQLVGDRIRTGVEDARFPDGEGARTVTITVSVGIATFPADAHDAERLVRNADKALYLAKRMGKNRVETYS